MPGLILSSRVLIVGEMKSGIFEAFLKAQKVSGRADFTNPEDVWLFGNDLFNKRFDFFFRFLLRWFSTICITFCAVITLAPDLAS